MTDTNQTAASRRFAATGGRDRQPNPSLFGAPTMTKSEAELFQQGRAVASELARYPDASALRPSRDSLKKAAISLGITAAQARRALTAFVWN